MPYVPPALTAAEARPRGIPLPEIATTGTDGSASASASATGSASQSAGQGVQGLVAEGSTDNSDVGAGARGTTGIGKGNEGSLEPDTEADARHDAEPTPRPNNMTASPLALNDTSLPSGSASASTSTATTTTATTGPSDLDPSILADRLSSTLTHDPSDDLDPELDLADPSIASMAGGERRASRQSVTSIQTTRTDRTDRTSDSLPSLSRSGDPTPSASSTSIASLVSSDSGADVDIGGDDVSSPPTSVQGIMTPSEEGDAVTRYRHGLYVYTRTLYLEAKRSLSVMEKKHQGSTHGHFGGKQSGMERLAAKKALAKRLNG